MELKIEYLSPDELKAYEKNAKLHPDEQIVQIMKSIEEFGMNDPIAIWKDNVVIEGHGRLKACLELGIEKVPVIRLDNLTDEQRRAYALIHNKLTMNSGFELSSLSSELNSIFDLDMSDFGFGAFEMNAFEEDYEPEEYDKDLEAQYGENGLVSFNCIISCTSEYEKEEIKKILRENNELQKLYSASKIIERFN